MWNFRDIPRDLMRKVKMAAAHEGKTVKDFHRIGGGEDPRVRVQRNSAKGEVTLVQFHRPGSDDCGTPSHDECPTRQIDFVSQLAL